MRSEIPLKTCVSDPRTLSPLRRRRRRSNRSITRGEMKRGGGREKRGEQTHIQTHIGRGELAY